VSHPFTVEEVGHVSCCFKSALNGPGRWLTWGEMSCKDGSRLRNSFSGYGNTLNAEIVGSSFIPANHEMIVKVQVSYKYEDLDTTFQDTADEKKSEIFAFKRLNRIDNF